jgi:hypothetical protein
MLCVLFLIENCIVEIFVEDDCKLCTLKWIKLTEL